MFRVFFPLNIIIWIPGANEEDIDKAIDNKDMKKLVDYILDGDADKLRDRSSDDEEVQELINGVPKFEVISLLTKGYKNNVIYKGILMLCYFYAILIFS